MKTKEFSAGAVEWASINVGTVEGAELFIEVSSDRQRSRTVAILRFGPRGDSLAFTCEGFVYRPPAT